LAELINPKQMATKVKVSKSKGPIGYPEDHKPGMKVPLGGSNCGNCLYWDGSDCENEYYRKWNNGSGKIPVDNPEGYCSDWWTPKR
jgi:hypothetical protein